MTSKEQKATPGYHAVIARPNSESVFFQVGEMVCTKKDQDEHRAAGTLSEVKLYKIKTAEGESEYNRKYTLEDAETRNRDSEEYTARQLVSEDKHNLELSMQVNSSETSGSAHPQGQDPPSGASGTP